METIANNDKKKEELRQKRLKNLVHFKPGQSGNPSGRPKGSLKDYMRKKLADMPIGEKEKFLKKIAPEIAWKMAEGNPTNEITGQMDIKVGKLDEISKATKEILK